jgi:hypothetical protein
MIAALDYYSESRPRIHELLAESAQFDFERVASEAQVQGYLDFDGIVEKITGLKTVRARIHGLEIE